MRNIFTFLVAATMMIAGISSTAFAQHCRWDGGRTLVVSLKDKFGVAIVGVESQLKLKEIDNEDPSRCSFADKLVEKDLAPAESFLKDVYKQYFDTWLKDSCDNCGITDESNYAVKIGQAETICMIKNENDYTYVKRKYVVEYSGITPAVQIPVAIADFQVNCKGNTEWKPAKPLKF